MRQRRRVTFKVALVVAGAMAAPLAMTSVSTAASSPATFRFAAASPNRGGEIVSAQPPRGALDLGRTRPTAEVRAEVALRPRSEAVLHRLVAAVSSPTSPMYRHFLRKGQFGPRFGASPRAVAAVRRGLARLGLRTGPLSPNRLLLQVHGSVSSLDAALHVVVHRFRLPTGQLLDAALTAPVAPTSIAGYVQAVVGLGDVGPGSPATSAPRQDQGHRQGHDARHCRATERCADAVHGGEQHA